MLAVCTLSNLASNHQNFVLLTLSKFIIESILVGNFYFTCFVTMIYYNTFFESKVSCKVSATRLHFFTLDISKPIERNFGNF